MEKIISGGETIDIPIGKTVQIIAAIVPNHVEADGYDLQVSCKSIQPNLGYTDCIHLKNHESIKVPDANHIVLNKIVRDKQTGPLKNFSVRLALHDEIGEYYSDVKAVYKFVDILDR